MSVHFLKDRKLWFAKWRENGKEKRKYFKTEKAAQLFDEERQRQPDSERLTFGELVIKYFHANPDRHPHTKQSIINILAGHDDRHGKHVEGQGEFLRDKFADALSRQDLEKLREAYRKRGTSNASINRYQAYIRAILSWGVEQELLPYNPWRDFRLLKTVKPIFQPKVEDLRKLFTCLPEYLQWAVKTAFFLALRPGQVELFSLTWDAFNWNRNLVLIRQGKSGRLKTVILHPSYRIEAYNRYLEDMKAGIPLVCHRQGQRVLSFRTSWVNACKRANVKLRPYDIRHIAASEMLANGADLAAVAAQLGHASVATTGAIYAHVTSVSQQLAANVMPALEENNNK